MDEIKARDGTTYVTELLPGEKWIICNDCIVIGHPDRPPFIVGGAAIDPCVVGTEIHLTPALAHSNARTIRIKP